MPVTRLTLTLQQREGWAGNPCFLQFRYGCRLLTVELHVPGSQSLKDKRMVLRRIKDRLKKFNVAVSEVEHQDLWQRAALAVVTVSTDEKHADRELAAVADEIERVEPGLITRTEVEFLTQPMSQGSRPDRVADQTSRRARQPARARGARSGDRLSSR